MRACIHHCVLVFWRWAICRCVSFSQSSLTIFFQFLFYQETSSFNRAIDLLPCHRLSKNQEWHSGKDWCHSSWSRITSSEIRYFVDREGKQHAVTVLFSGNRQPRSSGQPLHWFTFRQRVQNFIWPVLSFWDSLQLWFACTAAVDGRPVIGYFDEIEMQLQHYRLECPLSSFPFNNFKYFPDMGICSSSCFARRYFAQQTSITGQK